MRPALQRFVNAAWRAALARGRPTPEENRRRLAERGESPDALRIREATVADLRALAELHVTTWNATYGPMGAQGPSVEVRERQWRERFAANEAGAFCLVVENARGELVGFASAERSDHPVYAGRLDKIHLLRDYQRLGLGRRLVALVARRFLAAGIEAMWLFGDARNPSAAAWLALGAEKTDDDPGNGNYGWQDLRALVERCEGVETASDVDR